MGSEICTRDSKAIAFDVNAACSGFVFALNVAKMYIETGFVKNALVIGSETLSKILDWNDRGTCVLFGDGAGAAYIEESDKGIISIVQGSIGKKGMVLNCESRKTNNIFVKDEINHDYLYMDGQEVYKFAVRQCPKCLQEALDKAGMTVDDVDYFVLHQANVRIIESVAKRLKAPLEKFPTTLDYTGNMSAASVPVLLDQLVREHGLKRGDKIAMSAFGAGLTYGAVVMEW